ncbi:hypothetical protein LJB97_04325 [Parabacteroides sp. OttesenSCG-928-O15]|nr:hypothetical protein [Parabacteroides sp. OttesenSCG-928-O15]
MNQKQYTPSAHNALRFRRWSRKGYAAFVSLHHTVNIGRLASRLADRFYVKQHSLHGVMGAPLPLPPLHKRGDELLDLMDLLFLSFLLIPISFLLSPLFFLPQKIEASIFRIIQYLQIPPLFRPPSLVERGRGRGFFYDRNL